MVYLTNKKKKCLSSFVTEMLSMVLAICSLQFSLALLMSSASLSKPQCIKSFCKLKEMCYLQQTKSG